MYSVCRKTFDISNMGEAALSSHAKGAKHQSAAACLTASNPIAGFFTHAPEMTPTPSCGSGASISSTVKQGTILSHAVSRNETLTAEVLYTTKIVIYFSKNMLGVTWIFFLFNIYT